MHKHDWRKDEYVDNEANQLLGGDLCGLRQGIGHGVEGWENGREDNARCKASPVCLDTEAGNCQ